MAIQKHIYDVPSGSAIYGETANINYFLTTPLVPASVGSVVDKQSAVKASTRRRYVGDPAPSNVSATTRDYLFDPGRRNGAATPGKSFTLDDGTEKRQFTYTGSFTDLHSFLILEVSKDCTVYSPSASYELTAIV
jgi:hypothetical protein